MVQKKNSDSNDTITTNRFFSFRTLPPARKKESNKSYVFPQPHCSRRGGWGGTVAAAAVVEKQ